MLVSPRAFPMPFAMPSTMKAVAQDSYGTVAVLTTGDVATPTISENQVLIRVRAAGVNIADWAVMNGLPYIARPVYGLRKPKNVIRGTDVAGTVEAVGSSITRFQPGDEVFGSSIGSYAEYSPANEDELALKPVNLSR
ncbi:MAG: alcohol dehydrogenase catalytic domain-containing protein [Candidatus Limnocylindria bacterium]